MALYHLGLTVSDLNRSLTFYREVAGMSDDDQGAALGLDRSDGDTGGQTALQTEAGQIISTTSDSFDQLTGNIGADLRVAFLYTDGLRLQLVQYVAGGGATLDLHHNNIGSPHLSFWVDDVESKFAELKRRGDVTITSELVQIVPTMRSFYTEDPDGLPVEFIQKTG